MFSPKLAQAAAATVGQVANLHHEKKAKAVALALVLAQKLPSARRKKVVESKTMHSH
jgi:2-methylcitrate dehydratase PrpD